jgi:serine/threonine protein kinase/Tol biopolymer transport system component
MDGQVFGHYRIIEKIGAGGMGDVFRARDERLGRDVAIKIIRPASGNNPDHLRRFEQEARAAAALNHPNILAIYDVGFEGTTPYIVSELLEGKTLRARLAEGALPVRETSGYALQIAHGLIAAHDRLIVHRDLKPENIFITNDARIKILDFGVAKLQPSPEEKRKIESLTTVTKHGAVIGTVAYMSPEQLRAKTVDHRSDIFSFGAILYEMLSGKRAFRGETEVDTMTAVLREEPSGVDLEEAAIPAGYQDIVKHCLEKEPENRFQSAKDLGFALQTLLGSSPGTTVVLPKVRAKSPSRLPWALVATLALAIAALSIAYLLRPAPTHPSYTRVTFESGTVYAARFASNGQSVIYSAAWNGKPVQLFSTIGNSLLSQPLSLTNATLLGVSRSNELALVLGANHTGQLETVHGMLAQAPLAGGSPRELLSDVPWADWDSQGKLAVVHNLEGQSRLEYPMGTALYRCGGWISNVRISPQGDKIAFMEHPALWDTRGDVRVIDLSGQMRTVSHEWESEAGLAWRPDGKEIWFTSAEKGNSRNLRAANLSGEIHTLLDLPMSLTLEDIAPDGRVLLSLNSQRLAMGFAAAGNLSDTELSWHDWNSARDISADGQTVLFEDSSEAAGPGYAVVTRSVDGTLPVRLGEGSSGGFSPDQKWAISISTSQAPQITLLPIGAGQPRVIRVTGLDHIHNGWARYLPNGQRIALNGDQNGHAVRCYAADATTGAAKPVTPEGVNCGPPSPDSRELVGVKRDRTFAIYPLDGGEARSVPGNNIGFTPVQWSDDGRFFFGYHTGEFPSRVFKMEIATGTETPLQDLRPGSPAGVVIVAPVIASRDGKHFTYSYNQTLSALYVVSGLQ